MKSRTNTAIRSSESGIAVILALGFMAVILALVLTFVDVSVLNQKISENYNNVQTARMATQTAYQRALATIDDFKTDSSKDMMRLFSFNSNVNTRSDSLDELMTTVINGVTYFSSYNSNEGPHWQYLPIDFNTDTPITARFAFAVIVDIGKIDPSAAIDSGVNAAAVGTPAIAETDATSTSTNPDGSYVMGRPGRNLSEMHLTSLPSSWFTSTYANKMGSTNASPAGKLAPGTRWDSYDTIFTELGISNDIIKDSFRNYFVLNNLPDPEAFWIDNGDNQREANELYHRFNLSRNDWDQITVDKLISAPLPFDENTAPEDIFSIHWLEGWQNAGNFPNSDSCRRQIAANLIDYCDSNTDATTDDENNPTYVGLESVPYINEIRFQIDAGVKHTYSPVEDKYNYQAFVNLENVVIELVKMYSGGTFNNLNASIEELRGTYKWSFSGITNGQNVDSTYTESFDESTIPSNSLNCEIDIGASPIPYAINSFGNSNFPGSTSSNISISSSFTDINTDYTDGGGQPSATNRRIFDFEITSLKIKLVGPPPAFAFFDYSNLNSNPYELRDAINDATEKTTYLDFQIADPRQNFLVEDWSDSAFATSANGTLNSINSVDVSSFTDSDIEVNYDPTMLSTAYIRNAPMQSPWEIGFIHRANPFQTINLKRYRSSSLIGSGGGSWYSDGDANILDQIKMTSNNITYGKVNLNTNIDEVLKMLFRKLYIGSNIASINGPGDPSSATEITSILADEIADSVLLRNGINGGEILLTRAQIVRESDGVISLYNNFLGLSETNDAAQEEIIGKCINLAKAAFPDFYTIIAVSQAIKDIGTIGVYETGTDVILSTQKILTTIQWDENEQEFRIIKYEYLD